MEPSNDDTQSHTDYDIDDDDDDDDDTILKKGEFVVFRSTGGSPFNILQLTKNYQQDSITPKTRIKRNSLTSEDHKSQEIVLFMSDPLWRNEYKLFAHALRDMDDKIVVLQMTTVDIDCEILFSITKDTFNELIH